MPAHIPARISFENNHIPEPMSGCWLWHGHTDKDGYGIMREHRKIKRAHRYSYEQFVGHIPDGKHVLHVCDTPCCVNPGHLRSGTDADNSADKILRKRQYKKLSYADVVGIRNDKRVFRLIAKDYDVQIPQISRIKNGKRWGHLK